ncbi:transmembrane protein 150A isoform X2 [Corythoichthys intestinalis]|uniref:transmembrane protein 150A isoform X2 n=1 Tax=Corythoichthys intestinalis TaxID=161448 RepID=UPI0025A5D59B|nr:transmembrane protein 150A isoform X2 [Corythoichthys intestinalis]
MSQRARTRAKTPYKEMQLWIFFPVVLSLTSFIGTWTVYGLAYSNQHVCSLTDWSGENFCTINHTTNCCYIPTISTSGTNAPENSLFTATLNACSFLFFLFCIFHHAHIMEKNVIQAGLSRLALAFGVVASLGSFAAGNCNPGYLTLWHHAAAGVSFTCICFYTFLLSVLTARCQLTGYENVLYPLRMASTVTQIILTLCYTFCFVHHDYYYWHLSAVFEWTLSGNLQLFELSFIVEFSFFSSYMLSNLFNRRDEEGPLVLV